LENDIKSSTGPNFDIISQKYHPLKNDINKTENPSSPYPRALY
jgi:hypothetical protein